MGTNLSAWLESQTEDDLRKLLADLLRTMGFLRVTITHGSAERGRDIVFLEKDRLGRDVWRAIQAKAKRFSGSYDQAGLAAALRQCTAALTNTFQLPTGEIIAIAEVWLVTSHTLSEQAKASVEGELHALRGVVLVDGAHLADLITYHLPDLVAHGILPLDYYIKQLSTYCDSVEDYVVSRTRARFSLPDVFVPPALAVRLINSSAPSSIAFTERYCNARVVSAFLDLANLSPRRMLPALRTFEILTAVADLDGLAAALKTLSPLSEQLRTDIEVAWNNAKQELRRIYPDLLAENESDAITTSTLSEADLRAIEQALDVGDPITRPVANYHALRKTPLLPHRSRSWKKRRADDRIVQDDSQAVARRRVEVSHDQFLTALRIAYNSSIDAADPMTALASSAARLIANLSTVQDVSRLRSAVDKLQSTLQRADQVVSEQLRIRMPQFQWSRDLESGSYDAMCELEQLTRFVEAFHGPISDDRITRLLLSAGEIATLADRLLVVAELGQGKTTLLKHLARQSVAITTTPLKHLPVFCSLSTLAGTDATAMESALKDIARFRSGVVTEVALQDAIWYLDGFDEIRLPATKAALLEWLTAQHGPNRAVMSSRPGAWRAFLPRVLVATLEPLSGEQISQLIHRFPWETASEPERLLEVVQAERGLQEIARNPLLLTLVILLAQSRGVGDLPTRREALYDMIVRLYLGEWDSSKHVERTYAITSFDERRSLLRRIAFELYSLGQRSFDREAFVAAALKARPLRPVSVELALRFLGDLLRDSVIVPLGAASLGFFHLSVQEYLSAEELRNDTTPDRAFGAVERFFATGGWWEEVLVFYAALSRDLCGFVNELHRRSIPSRDIEGRLNADLVRLLSRMLDVADFTKITELRPQGAVALALAELNFGDQGEKWRRRAPVAGAYL